MYTLKIKITKEILKQSMMCGVKKEGIFSSRIGANCAVALAVREIFPDAWVDGYDILPFLNKYVSLRDFMFKIQERYKIELPWDVRVFIQDFDCLASTPEERLNMPELEFEVSVPDNVIEKINIDEIKEILKTSKTLEIYEC